MVPPLLRMSCVYGDRARLMHLTRIITFTSGNLDRLTHLTLTITFTSPVLSLFIFSSTHFRSDAGDASAPAGMSSEVLGAKHAAADWQPSVIDHRLG